MDSTDMNTLSSLLLYIGQQLSALIIKSPRTVLVKGQQYTDKTFYGVTGFVGASNTAYITIPANLPSNVTDFDTLTSFKISLRTINNNYLGGDGTAGGVEMVSSITAKSVVSDQPMLRVVVQNSGFGSSVQHSPLMGQVQMTFKLK